MRILSKTTSRNILKQISFTPKTFKECLSGERGQKKQLLAFVVDSYEDDFLDLVLQDKKLSKLNGIQYLSIEQIEELFGFRKYNLEKWHSEEKLRLLRALKNTPICFVSHIQASLMALTSMSSLFAISKKTEPIKDICEECDLYDSCTEIKNPNKKVF